MRASSGETGSSQGSREHPQLHVETEAENVLDRDTEQSSDGAERGEICHSSGHFYGLGELGRGGFEVPSSSNQSDDSRESSIVPK